MSLFTALSLFLTNIFIADKTEMKVIRSDPVHICRLILLFLLCIFVWKYAMLSHRFNVLWLWLKITATMYVVIHLCILYKGGRRSRWAGRPHCFLLPHLFVFLRSAFVVTKGASIKQYPIVLWCNSNSLNASVLQVAFLKCQSVCLRIMPKPRHTHTHTP